MPAYADKIREFKASANTVAQAKAGSQAGFNLADNRPAATVQRAAQQSSYLTDNRPRVKQLKAITDNRASVPGLNTADQTIQRYALAEGGGRISETQQLLWRNGQLAYASAAKFDQANGIPGQVEFIQGAAAAEPYGELHRIDPQARAGSALAGSTAGYNVAAQEPAVTARAKEGYYPTPDGLTDQLWELIEAHLETAKGEAEIQQEFDTTDEEEIKAKIGPIAEIVVELLNQYGNFDESHVKHRVTAYFQSQVLNQHRPLMPSDCGEMAATITGAGGVRGETPAIAPGNAYAKTMNIANREAAQWDHHFAAIIMTDGTDHITMENAGAKKAEVFGKTAFDRTWFFEMYGPAAGQSFANKYNTDLGY